MVVGLMLLIFGYPSAFYYWAGEPFFLFLLRFDPLGKGLLTRDERHAANTGACAVIGATVPECCDCV